MSELTPVPDASSRTRSAAVAAPERRALIVKMGAIGDVVMALPAVRLLADESYAIDWVCGAAAAPVLRLFPWINVLVMDDRALMFGSVRERIAACLGLWSTIGRRSYDLAATLYYDRRYAVLTLPIRARRKLALSKDDRAFTLLAGRHHTDEYARILLGLPDAQRPSQLRPLLVPSLPPNPQPRTGSARPRIVLCPAGARNTLRDDALRRWPVENYVTLAQALLTRGYEVLLCGGPEDAWASAAFDALAVADLIGKLALPETLALFDSADVVCTHDTGPLHLAGMTSAAVLTLFGPTDPHGRLPQRENAVALWGGEGFACRPCYDGQAYAPACTDNLCIQQITPALALSHIERLLHARRTGSALAPEVMEPSAATRSLVQLTTEGKH